MNRIFRAFSLALSLALLTSFAVFFSAPHQAAAASLCKVGIYGATSSGKLADVQSKLNGTGLFTRVDVHDAGFYTPTLAELQQYSAVLVFCSLSFNDSTAMGDVLADYADAGGGVVVATFAFATSTTLDGRIVSGGYLPFTQGSDASGTPLTMIPDVPAHPILAGVSSFAGGASSFHNTISLTAGAFQIAHWSNEVPLVATKQPTTGKIVGLNFYPPSSDAQDDLWTSTTDGARLMGNALAWAGNCIIPETSGVVGIYGADDSENLTDVQSKLNGTGLFTRVDVHDVRYYTPNVSELQQYSAVFVYGDNAIYDRIALGDVLANYSDTGRGLVVTAFSYTTGFSCDIQGRILTGGYLPFTTGGFTEDTLLTLTPDLLSHPILAGVSTFDGGTSSYCGTISLTAGSTQVAHWSNDVPLVATKQPTTGKIVGLNFFPPSSDARADLWTATTDGARLMANSLLWASCIDSDNDTYGQGCAAGPDCDDNNSAIHNPLPYYRDADGDGYGVADNASEFCFLTPPAGYADNSSGFDVDDADSFYTDILPTCTARVIPKAIGWLIGDRERTRTLLIIGERGTSFGDSPAIKWESDAIEVVRSRVLFNRFMFMRVTFNGEPLDWEEYRVLIGDCEGSIKWTR